MEKVGKHMLFLYSKLSRKGKKWKVFVSSPVVSAAIVINFEGKGEGDEKYKMDNKNV